LLDIIDIVAATKIAGVIAIPTISREGLQSDNKSEMVGGQENQTKRSTEVIRFYLKKQ
jgi:hypothetical protein